MLWYGMVWYGMVWYGMVWYGIYKRTHLNFIGLQSDPAAVELLEVAGDFIRGAQGIGQGAPSL